MKKSPLPGRRSTHFSLCLSVCVSIEKMFLWKFITLAAVCSGNLLLLLHPSIQQQHFLFLRLHASIRQRRSGRSLTHSLTHSLTLSGGRRRLAKQATTNMYMLISLSFFRRVHPSYLRSFTKGDFFLFLFFLERERNEEGRKLPGLDSFVTRIHSARPIVLIPPSGCKRERCLCGLLEAGKSQQ